jgi:hypothetical protein
MEINRVFVKDKDLVTRDIAGEMIIVPVRREAAKLDSIFTLNEPGNMIWALIDGQTSVSHIVEALCNAYEVAPEEAIEDVADFLRSLEKAGLIYPVKDSDREAKRDSP